MKLNYVKRGSLCLAVYLILGAPACSHVEIERLPSNADPNVEMSKLEVDQKDADHRQLNVLAPTYYKKADEALKAAKEKRNQQKDNEDVLEKIGESRAYLRKCYDVGSLADPILRDVIQARSDALTAQAPIFASKELKDADDSLIEVALKLEDENTEKAENKRESLRQAYLKVELSAIKQSYLDPSRKLIKQATQEGAEKIAPKTLMETQATLDSLDSLITVDRHNQTEIQKRSKELVASGERLLRITRAANSAKKQDAESIVLGQEATEETVKQLAQATESTKDDQSLKEVYEFAKQQLSDGEAELFRANNQIIIRLKGLHFQNGTDLISGDNYSLLGKVQEVIRHAVQPQLGIAQITIEGHTDAKGTKLLNKKISLKRALSVKNYFVANQLLPESKITVLGKGDSKPIASNNSKNGRAQNRRVDIIIEAKHLDAS